MLPFDRIIHNSDISTLIDTGHECFKYQENIVSFKISIGELLSISCLKREKRLAPVV